MFNHDDQPTVWNGSENDHNDDDFHCWVGNENEWDNDDFDYWTNSDYYDRENYWRDDGGVDMIVTLNGNRNWWL